MSKDEFFVGYSNETPPKTKKLVKRVVIGLFILLPLLGGLMAFLHKEYSTGKYEFGKLTEVEGFISTEPVPRLKLIAGKNLKGSKITQSIVLVGYGKFGAKGIVDKYRQKIKSDTGEDFGNVKVKLEGTLAYNDGKAILELTKKEKALLSYEVVKDAEQLSLVPTKKTGIGRVTLKGEIIDPKCYFGAMNPGRGKSHKSCAIMCIRGGIPPMFVVQNENGDNGYYILTNTNRKALKDEVLDFVADPVSITGSVFRQDDWYELVITDPSKDIERL
ncbi:MAG: hypothetical protein AAF502_01955 [Bacteroidota bacterium]